MKATNSHQDQNVLKNSIETVISTDMALSCCYSQKSGSVKGVSNTAQIIFGL